MMKAKKAGGRVELLLSSLPTRKLNLNIEFPERNKKIPSRTYMLGKLFFIDLTFFNKFLGIKLSRMITISSVKVKDIFKAMFLNYDKIVKMLIQFHF